MPKPPVLVKTSSREKLYSAASMVFDALKFRSSVDFIRSKYFFFIFAVDLNTESKGSRWLYK